MFQLLRARLLVATVRFDKWRNRLGGQSGSSMGHEQLARARKLAAHVDWAARLLPIGTKCLPQAMALSFMLRSEQIGHQLVLAVRPPDARQQDDVLHAWIEICGNKILGDLAGPWVETLRLGSAD
jgi:hypothetical protein